MFASNKDKDAAGLDAAAFADKGAGNLLRGGKPRFLVAAFQNQRVRQPAALDRLTDRRGGFSVNRKLFKHRSPLILSGMIFYYTILFTK